MIKNIANSLLPYFAGDKQFDEAISDVCKLFIAEVFTFHIDEESARDILNGTPE